MDTNAHVHTRTMRLLSPQDLHMFASGTEQKTAGEIELEG